jgi:hypothetical protein
MIGWAVDSGGDDIIGETFDDAEKDFCVLDVIRQTGLPGIIPGSLPRGSSP